MIVYETSIPLRTRSLRKYNPDEIIKLLKERNGGKPYASMKELQGINKDLTGNLKTLSNKANEYFGTTLKKYLQKEGGLF